MSLALILLYGDAFSCSKRYFFNAIARSLGGVPLGAMEKYARRKSPEHERVIETIKAKYW